MKHLAGIQNEFLKEARDWDELSYEEQKAYISRHPNSKRRMTAKPSGEVKKEVAPKQESVSKVEKPKVKVSDIIDKSLSLHNTSISQLQDLVDKLREIQTGTKSEEKKALAKESKEFLEGNLIYALNKVNSYFSSMQEKLKKIDSLPDTLTEHVSESVGDIDKDSINSLVGYLSHNLKRFEYVSKTKGNPYVMGGSGGGEMSIDTDGSLRSVMYDIYCLSDADFQKMNSVLNAKGLKVERNREYKYVSFGKK